MFDFNCFVFGWCSACSFITFMDKRPLASIVCLLGAVTNAIILYR